MKAGLTVREPSSIGERETQGKEKRWDYLDVITCELSCE